MGQIIIEIDKNGDINVEAVGFKGKMCHSKLQELQPLLGKLMSSKKKAEFYQEDKVRISAKAE
jgi:hypothetical protein